MVQLSLNEFHNIRDFIHEKTGIFLPDDKMYFLENRLENRWRELTCGNATDYYRFLTHAADDAELKALIEVLTVNETFFFRDYPQLKAFAYEALPALAAAKKANGDSTIRIWSAGCSSGEEPYTLAMMAQEVLKDINYKIVATDINQRVLRTARTGIYSGRSIKFVPALYLCKYFAPRGGEEYEIAPEIKNHVEFATMNFVDKLRMRLMCDFDIIFCRNVIIYFSITIQKQIMRSFYDSLRKHGYVFLGSAESMHMLSGAFKLVKFNEVFGYIKE